jgi:dolichyl-phosphate-mannose-protein mannosyltransferase
LLAAYLRITGLTWGLGSGYGHDRNFHPDEFVSLRGVLQVDLPAGRIKVPGAYFEGTFNYYLWAVPQMVLKISSHRDVHFAGPTSVNGISELLYICRWMSVLLDLCTMVIISLAIREATQSFYASLLGALCYAVVPIQVIYAHFMRTHILSNLLCALVVWLSLKLRKTASWQLLLCVGLISGFGAATRYPVGIVVVVPCLYLLFDGRSNLPNSKARLWERLKNFVARQVWLIGSGFVIALFLGHPMLFFDPSSVIKAITGETLKYASLQQFSTSKLLNLSLVWSYITYVLPFAMYPLLWLILYCGIVYALFKRNLYSLTMPILIFSFLYLYFMGKGYLGPYFARVTMLLLPGFCILFGIGYADLQLRLRNNRLLTAVLTGAILFVPVPSVVFDIAYVRAMQQKDARQVVREDLQKAIGEAPATVGVWHYGPYFYTAMPAARPLRSQKITVLLQESPEQNADFFLVGFPNQIEPAGMNAIITGVEAQGKFKFERSYSVPVKIFGHEFSLMRFPGDMTYPFPTILLFRARTST